MKVQICKWGNSLAIRIPGTTAKQMRLKEGSELDLSLEGAKLVLRNPESRPHYSLDELLEGITPDNVHPETDWGKPVGNEIID